MIFAQDERLAEIERRLGEIVSGAQKATGR
jgi:hypothetical protein